MHFNKFYAGSDSFITFPRQSLLASTSSEIMCTQFHRRKEMRRKFLAKQHTMKPGMPEQGITEHLTRTEQRNTPEQ